MINSQGLAGPLPHGVVLLNIFCLGFFLPSQFSVLYEKKKSKNKHQPKLSQGNKYPAVNNMKS